MNKFVKICDPRHSYLINKNKWLVIDELNNAELLIEYTYNEKPNFSSEFCKKYLPKLFIRKINKKILYKLFYFLNLDIIEKIISFLPDKYVTTVEKRFCRNLENKWIIDGNRIFNNYLKNQFKKMSWKWYGGDDDGYNIGWVMRLPYSDPDPVK